LACDADQEENDNATAAINLKNPTIVRMTKKMLYPIHCDPSGVAPGAQRNLAASSPLALIPSAQFLAASTLPISAEWEMPIRLIKHEAVSNCGSYEVQFSDGRPSRYFYWDDEASRRLRPELLAGHEAEQKAKACARAERDLSAPK
jgi:hypothetical protein